MIKSHQKAVHTNGYRINYRHTNSAYGRSGYNNHTNYGNYARSGYNNHTDRSSYSRSGSDDHTDRRSSGWTMNGNWYANHNDRGYDDHTDRSTYTKSGYNNHTNRSAYSRSGYDNHTNRAAVNSTAETSRTPTNTKNEAPKISGSTFPTSRYYNSKSIKILLNSLSYSDDNTSTATKYRIYYQYCATQNGTYGNWTQLSEQTALSYTWNASNATAYPGGWYKIGVTVYDNGSWSAKPSGNGWTYDHVEDHPTNGVTAANNGTGYQNYRQDSTKYETTFAAVSSPIRIYHYSSPANDSDNNTNWNTDYYSVENIEQVQDETNKVLSAMGQSTITFTNTPVVSNFTIITWQDMQELRSGVTTAYQLKTNTAPTLSPQSDWIENQKIIDIQDLLDILGEGDN